jgi:hypothetical protein
MRKSFVALATGMVIAAGTAFVVPGMAQATDEDPRFCPTWSLRSIVGTTWQQPADGSGVVDGDTVVLTKPQGGGTEFAAFNVGFTTEPVDITVHYSLSADADHAAGAVRLFYYQDNDADTLNTAPDGFAAADADSGTLTLTDVTTIGTLGLVYDASNNAGGSVTFTDLKIGNVRVKFKDVCSGQSPSPEPSSPTPTPTGASPSASASESTSMPPTASETPAPGAGGDGGDLPVTGVPGPVLAAVATALIIGGGVLLVVARRRRDIRYTV